MYIINACLFQGLSHSQRRTVGDGLALLKEFGPNDSVEPEDASDPTKKLHRSRAYPIQHWNPVVSSSIHPGSSGGSKRGKRN